MYTGYQQVAPTTPDIYAQAPYARFPPHPTAPFHATSDVVVKTETDTSVTQGYFPNGGFPVITESLKAHPYYAQPQYTTSVYSSGAPISSNAFESEQAINGPPAYDQFRLTPPTSKDVGFEQTTENGEVYWSNEEGVNRITYETEQPAKRARYSSENFSS